ncbi:MAG: ABC transporter ATP-binding protein [Candidatus Ancillula sp.]|jgi:putative ABC transport system ATP-binding protein|nr:ABC transporter ATP-binding protein [Candidatus Ancillula sp.]
MNSTDTLFETQNLAKVYTQHDVDFFALKDVNLTIKQGVSLAIVGKSGSGKSTMLNILSLMDTHTSGTLKILGQDATELSTSKKNALRSATFGFVFQQFFLNENLNVLENVMTPLEIAGVRRSQRDAKAVRALELVGLEDKLKNMAHELSGGQKQRVCIARAIVNEPKVIFADEPTGSLDTENSQLVESLLFNLQKETGIALLLVTHDNELAAKCEEVITIKDGALL